MATTADFRNGITIEMDSILYTIVYFQHVKPGKGGAFVRTRLKNLKTGAVMEKTFRAGEKVELAILDNRRMQYLYREGDDFVFMDNETYEQLPIPEPEVADAAKYLKEGITVDIPLYEGKPVGVEPPVFVEMEVTETMPGVKGDTASGGSKPAVMETGLVVNVPLFIEVGNIIKVDTRSGEYLERVK
ncbi:MAG: elongation factor P [Actinobacteria bacterium RBG_19FT_COMBO_54_7]|uniref:Elongation factor P n=1 Tax=Candidatus Solincola sediminis TaxID=1797199 RepID=A0A1F2WSC4_9ACTN|nr:MAG: elongation factor P [Candidatus Solincola sediminis]OFW70603.1 MAG: elongation factor P [Actinobacteria bacterium RBG_19FT_COMBO_54_7]